MFDIVVETPCVASPPSGSQTPCMASLQQQALFPASSVRQTFSLCSLSLKWYPDIYIAAQFFGLVAVHQAKLQRTQRKIVSER